MSRKLATGSKSRFTYYSQLSQGFQVQTLLDATHWVNICILYSLLLGFMFILALLIHFFSSVYISSITSITLQYLLESLLIAFLVY